MCKYYVYDTVVSFQIEKENCTILESNQRQTQIPKFLLKSY